MVHDCKGASIGDSIPELVPKDSLRRETQNERLCAMRIVNLIKDGLKVSWSGIEKELSEMPADGWDSPGERVDLSFLRNTVQHA